MTTNKIPAKQVYMETMGCFKNQYDSEIMLSSLVRGGFNIVAKPELADLLVINTCAFLSEAAYESINRILALSKYKKKSAKSPLNFPPKLVVVGCLASRYKDKLLDEIPEIDAIMGTSDYTLVVPLLEEVINRIDVNNQSKLAKIPQKYNSPKPVYQFDNIVTSPIAINQGHLRFLKIAEGCSNACSFCNIPLLRGEQVSRPSGHILAEFNQFLDWGVKEINILSQNTSSYGFDQPKAIRHNLADLIEKMITSRKNKSDYWLRVLYSYPNHYPKEIFSMMAQYPSLVPYIDMPFQHINDVILKKMNRRITKHKIVSLLDTAFQILPDLSLRSTFIVGFPGETSEMFAELYDFINQKYFHHIGVFTYSEEDNIKSRKYKDDVPQEEKMNRQKTLLDLQNKISNKRNIAYIGKTVQVLVDKQNSKHNFTARTANQAFEVDGITTLKDMHQKAVVGSFAKVKITKASGHDLWGELV